MRVKEGEMESRRVLKISRTPEHNVVLGSPEEIISRHETEGGGEEKLTCGITRSMSIWRVARGTYFNIA